MGDDAVHDVARHWAIAIGKGRKEDAFERPLIRCALEEPEKGTEPPVFGAWNRSAPGAVAPPELLSLGFDQLTTEETELDPCFRIPEYAAELRINHEP
jgi:hypothetical protein